MHDLRHGIAVHADRSGLDVVSVNRQLGDKDPAVTLRVYADVFDRARHTPSTRSTAGL